ncbi:MAG: hypothetical protein ABI459_04690 [Deltaproteobacteria bacterium]
MRLAVLLALVASPLFAETVAIPVGGKTITFDVPDGYVQTFEQATDKAFIRGYSPPEVADKPWTELITLTVTRNLAGLPSLSTVDFANFGLSALQSQCLGDFGKDVISAEDYTVSGQPALAIFIACANDTGKPDGHAQQVAFIAFRGTGDFYAIQWIERSAPSEKAAPYDKAIWQDRVDMLVASARLCDLKDGEAAPCP